MANRMKAKGDKYERDVLAIAHEAGFTRAQRTRPGRREDEGDIHLTDQVIVQCKDVATPRWWDWLAELSAQTTAARAEHGFLVVKRRGAGARPALHLAVMPLDRMLALIAEPVGPMSQRGILNAANTLQLLDHAHGTGGGRWSAEELRTHAARIGGES